MVGDVGALPHPGLGAELEASLQGRHLRAVALGAFFPSQATRVEGARGGDFQLVLGGLLGCLTHALDRLAVLACAGGELGRLAGEGRGVTTPRLGAALWAAGRADLGATWALSARAALALRAGVALPLSRRTFILDDTIRVHQPGRVTARAALALELAL
jgi:hypothetical protein